MSKLYAKPATTFYLRLLMLLLSISVLFNPAAVNAQGTKTIVVASPDGQVRIKVFLVNQMLNYTVTYKNNPVILSSAMGLVVNRETIGNAQQFGTVKNYAVNQTYGINGVHSTAVDHCNGKTVQVISNETPLTLDVRAYNNGIAFKYSIANKGEAVISKDLTQFNIPEGTTVWSQANIKYYEGSYSQKNIADFKAGDLAGPPATLQFAGNKGYAAITEGGLIDFAGMSLIASGNNGFTANLTGDTKKTGDFDSPWRIVEIGADLNSLVNCDIVTNVSKAPDATLFPQGNLTTWVKPGKSVWSWLAEKQAITSGNMKHFSDLAAELGFEYNLVDEGWGNWKDGDRDKWDLMKELVDYSAKKGVKIWVWKAYPDRAGIPGINTPEKRRDFFKKCKELGIAGLKVDFFDSEAQEINDFYQVALKDAAEYQLMMDFHGANKPTGQNRTWPNELTREAIRGLENSPPWAPGNVTLPFTRFLAGPADFTPIHFGKRMGEVTWAHHVATMVVFTSPLMCLGADPQSILDNPCKLMIQQIPPTWDETIVLPQSKIGDLALFARRKGTTWFIAGLNGKSEPKTISIPLSFLKKGKYALTTLKDMPAVQANVVITNSKIAAGASVIVNMNKTGGFVMKLDPVSK
ncbi:glycoside hydrolase family 97 protein [Mucilaginibacter glaciei]|uniref:Glycoside hydrolase family 97 catalytic domain-containing protein n=1 Tax=Mucilaginibacter glaciei TaxID=2772109 RepID=A0A926NXA0_9SPHI|nr:glycoside hydrolase family 97 protein [Mucilaginibacter glaciei]MBD1393394.1 glycoside hydrolase family 97 catalytic domain-containing protein [Mucilaginibacter glaciei]